MILCSLGHKSRDVTAKQMDGAVPIFVLLLYEKYIPHKYLSTFIRNFKKIEDDNVFSVCVKL